ncbi:MAG: hypothetical protein ACKOU7_09940 [Ferruginibacter sp.]
MKIILTAIAAITLLLFACNNRHQEKPVPDGKVFNGKWTYRSLLNNSNVNADFDSLEFAAATISLGSFGTDSLKGQILWAMDSAGTIFNGLNLRGRCYYNDTTLCYFIEGFGDSTLGTAGWQYNYQGYLVPRWPDGIDQAVVLAGSVVRVKKHSCDSLGNNCSPAGVVATTYMVKQ